MDENGGISLKPLRNIVCFLLVIAILFTSHPSSYAANEDSVLTSIGHSDTDTVTLSSTTRNVTLTVPYDYKGTTVYLINGLDISYDETLYKSVVAVPASAAIVNETSTDLNYVPVTVSFNLINDADGTEKSLTTYYVRIEREKATPAEFSGVIDKTVQSGQTITFTASDFEEDCYRQNDGKALGSIAISGSNLVTGTLKYDGGDYTFGSSISADLIGKLTFDALSSGEVSYDITAYEAETSTVVGTAVLTITVYSLPKIKSDYTYSTYVGSEIEFTRSSFTDLCDMQGGSLNSVEITPESTDCGAWSFKGTPLTVGAANVIPTADIGKLTFECDKIGTVDFTWRASNNAGFSQSFGSGTITITSLSLTLSSYSASSKLIRGSTYTISKSDFSYSPSSVSIAYLKIVTIPSASDGYLCLTTALAKDTNGNYPAIAANIALTAGAVIPNKYIQYLKLVTKSTGTGSTIFFTWTVTSDSTVSTATWASAASYTVKFVSGGTLTYDTYINIPFTLEAADFSERFADETGYSLSYIIFTPPVKTSGSLYYNYNVSTKTGTAVASATKYYANSSPNLSAITFVPATDYTGTVSIAYKAYKADGTYVAGELKIDVSNSSGGVLSYTSDKNANLQFDAAHFAKAYLNATGKALSYVKFTLPSTTYGKLYYNYISSSNYDSTVSSSTKYHVFNSPYLSYITFVPHKDYTGTITISYTAYDSSGDSSSGKLVIFIVDSPAGIVSYPLKVNGSVALSGDDFADEFISVTGSVLSYVLFTPPAATSGTLYYNYSPDTKTGTKVMANTKYYNGTSPDISDITFIPAADYAGNIEVKYTVYTSSGTSYAGKLKFTVGEASGNITYSTDVNSAISFQVSDFVSKFYAETGLSLAYVMFSPPSSTYGKLYYNYISSSSYGSAISASTAYYVNLSPYLSNITFVPKTGYIGSFTIPYTGYTSEGKGYSGKVSITVESDSTIVSYTTSSQEEVTFSSSDFSDAFENDTGKTLTYVKFTLPSSAYGKLYYGYSSSSSYTSTVSSSTRYYVDSSQYLSRVTFVPNSSFTGTVTIEYTAYDKSGESYDEALVITVLGSSGGTVEYQTDKNTPVTLNSADFNDEFLAQTGSTLSYLIFTLPTSTYGQLYYGYTSSTNYTSKVSASTKYYRNSSPQISNITFVPGKDFTGTVTIAYTCYSAGGSSYSGELDITINDTNVQPFADVGTNYAWADTAISYLYEEGVIIGSGDGKFYPASSVSRGDFILMICRALGFTTSDSGNFADVSPKSYYYNAIATAKALGIVQGSGSNFYPDEGLTRQDAAVIIARAMKTAGVPIGSGLSGDLTGFSDKDDISDYAADAMASLVKAGILQGSNGRLNPKSMVSRAEMATILYRVLTV
ncbi:hypothetical protein SDC9_55396 [bioreactor metagenome]|uniref:SLH domain-containing protein n=1 Tax=bioreactor metagenome TaxID=1076179 RepID=A0A644WYT8_9ZZZZ